MKTCALSKHTFVDHNALDVTGNGCCNGRFHLSYSISICKHTKRERKIFTFMALRTNGKILFSTLNSVQPGVFHLPQTGSPFLISWPSLTLTSTTTPDIGAPIEPGSEVAFSRDKVSTAELLSSTDTARTCHNFVNNDLATRLKVRHLSVDFEPHIALCATFDDRTNSHETDDQSLSLLNGDVHFLANVWPSQEVARWDDTREHENIAQLRWLLKTYLRSPYFSMKPWYSSNTCHRI